MNRFRLLTGALLCACSGDAPSDDSHESGRRSTLEARLADSVAFTNELIGTGYLHRVEVRAGDTVDTLPGVLTDRPPLVLGDTAVIGFAHDQNRITGIFRHVPGRGVTHQPLPADMYPYGRPALAPDGRHVAYLAVDSAGRGMAAVASTTDGSPVYRGPPVRMLETDAGVDRVSWSDSTHFEVQIGMSMAVAGTQRVRGAIGGSAQVDTLRD